MTESADNLEVYRRRVPHWRLSGSIYFVTWRLHPYQPILQPDERELVKSAIFHFDGQKYALFAWVVMHNHMHVIVQPLENHRLQNILHSWKSFSANILQRNFGRQNRIWQDEYFDRIIRDEAEFLEKAQYILNNPFKTWPDLGEYRWVGYSRMAGTEARPTGVKTQTV
jgi:REP element-mobilizing transposase RayT